MNLSKDPVDTIGIQFLLTFLANKRIFTPSKLREY